MQLKLNLLLLILRTATGSPYSKQTTDDYDYPDNDGQDINDNENEISVYETPKFITKPQTLLVNEGDTIRLPCFVDRLEGFVMLWKRNMDIVTVGHQIVDKNVRLDETKNGNSLVIGPASPADEADYTCQISSYKPSEIVHSVKIRVKPVIMISPTDVLVVTEGSPAHISCSIVAGSPTPQLTWSRRHQEMPDNGVKELGGVLHFQEANRHHSGHYVCSADNGFGSDPVTREIKLTVHHAPAVEHLPQEIHTGLGAEETLTCVVHSSPRAEVIWTRDGVALDSGSQGVDIRQEGNRHILSVSLDTREMFGEYRCQASNELGSAHTSAVVTGLAAPPVFSSADISLYPDSYTLSWTANSKTEITSFRVLYKETRSETWNEMEVTPRQSSIDPMGGGTWEGSALLSHLNSATQYEAKVLPHNFFGFTQPKQVFNFATKGAVPYHQPSTSGSGSNVQFITASLIAISFLLYLVR